MRIAQIVCKYPPYYSGMGNVVFQMTSELIKRGHQVEVFTPQYDEPTEPELEYVKRLRPSLKYGNAARIGQVAGALGEFDLVHLHYPFFGTANVVRKWKRSNPQKSLILTYHMDARSPGWKGLIFKLYAKYWMPKILDQADKILVSSFEYARTSDAAAHLVANADKWIELPFAVDTGRFMPREKPSALFKRYDLNEQNPTVLFVGAMDDAHHFKGVSVLLRSLFFLKQNNYNIQAIFVGGGDRRDDYRMRATGMGLDDRVRFVGYVNESELPYHYNMGDLFVLPSTDKGEAFGMVLLEAMASGVPVVASDLPGVKKVARSGGVTVNPGDERALSEAISDFFSQDLNRSEWQKQVRAEVMKNYSWQQIGGELEKIYTQVVV